MSSPDPPSAKARFLQLDRPTANSRTPVPCRSAPACGSRRVARPGDVHRPAAPARQIQLRISELPDCNFASGAVRKNAASLRRSASSNARSNASSTTKWLSPPDAMMPTRCSRRERRDRRRQRLAQGEAACRRRLVRRKIGVQEHRHDRHHAIRHAEPVHIRIGVALVFPVRHAHASPRCRSRPLQAAIRCRASTGWHGCSTAAAGSR